MNDMAMQAISMMQAQSPNTLISLKQQVKSDEAMVNMLSESQRNLA